MHDNTPPKQCILPQLNEQGSAWYIWPASGPVQSLVQMAGTTPHLLGPNTPLSAVPGMNVKNTIISA